MGSESQVSGVGQTASIGRSTSVSSGAAKVFREFKWGLLTLFLLMVVVVGLVYDGGAKKKVAEKPKTPDAALDIGFDNTTSAVPPVPGANGDSFLAPVPGADPGVGAPPAIPGNPNPMDFVAVPPALPGTTPVPPQPTQPQTHPTVGAYVAPDGITPVLPVPQNDPRYSVAPTPQPTQPVPPVAKKTYTVKSGDTLSSIVAAQKLGKGGLKALIAANKTTLPNPDRLKVGMVLNVPEVTSTTAKPTEANTTQKIVAGGATEGTKPENQPKGDVKVSATSDYTVQSGDTLERIARKVFNDGRRWKDIQNWNRDQLADPSRLRIGQVLKIKQVTEAVPVKPVKNTKVSEAEVDADTAEPKVEVADTLPKPEVAKEKTVAVKEKKAKREQEPQVEVMSSAFAP